MCMMCVYGVSRTKVCLVWHTCGMYVYMPCILYVWREYDVSVHCMMWVLCIWQVCALYNVSMECVWHEYVCDIGVPWKCLVYESMPCFWHGYTVCVTCMTSMTRIWCKLTMKKWIMMWNDMMWYALCVPCAFDMSMANLCRVWCENDANMTYDMMCMVCSWQK